MKVPLEYFESLTESETHYIKVSGDVVMLEFDGRVPKEISWAAWTEKLTPRRGKTPYEAFNNLGASRNELSKS